MGAASRAFYDQALERFGEAVENLVCEEFLRGSDALGARGREIVAATLCMLSQALAKAAAIVEKESR